jgi:hypothetical protein
MKMDETAEKWSTRKDEKVIHDFYSKISREETKWTKAFIGG